MSGLLLAFDPAGYVRKSGDAMTGALSLAGDPTQALHAVPKQYLDAQKQRISLAGGKQFDVQVPAGAKLARLTAVIFPTTSANMQPCLQVSVAPGVFISGATDYQYSGYAHASNVTPTTVSGAHSANFHGILLGNHAHTTLPAHFEAVITLARPTTAHFFQSDVKSAAWTSSGNVHSFYSNYVMPVPSGSALSLLAFRLLSVVGDSWAAESYLNVEWL